MVQHQHMEGPLILQVRSGQASCSQPRRGCVAGVGLGNTVLEVTRALGPTGAQVPSRELRGPEELGEGCDVG